MSRLPAVALAALLFTAAAPALAQPLTVDVELNKLEAVDGACRAFFVVRNPGETGFDGLDLDLVTFRPNGVIGARFQVELAPVPATKTVVKPFDLTGVDCGDVDRLLLNAILTCAPMAPAACRDAVEPSSLTVDFFE